MASRIYLESRILKEVSSLSCICIRLDVSSLKKNKCARIVVYMSMVLLLTSYYIITRRCIKSGFSWSFRQAVSEYATKNRTSIIKDVSIIPAQA